jgi:hypothetical protein
MAFSRSQLLRPLLLQAAQPRPDGVLEVIRLKRASFAVRPTLQLPGMLYTGSLGFREHPF